MMRILLDTHVFLWAVAMPERLSKAASDVLQDAGVEVWLSVVSAWEIEIKTGLGKLTLQRTLGEILAEEQSVNGLGVLPMRLSHVLTLGQLPVLHRDPFDRLLIAQARVENLTLVTADQQIQRYPIDHLW
ncbi:MAG: type II toxin-antitoxin system VapC family toxin [Gammaproteobacteria bacterium]